VDACAQRPTRQSNHRHAPPIPRGHIAYCTLFARREQVPPTGPRNDASNCPALAHAEALILPRSGDHPPCEGVPEGQAWTAICSRSDGRSKASPRGRSKGRYNAVPDLKSLGRLCLYRYRPTLFLVLSFCSLVVANLLALASWRSDLFP